MEGLSDYFQRLERLLDCPKPLRSSFVHQTRRMSEDFIQGNPDATPQEIAAYLGEPEELAQGFLETLDPDLLNRYRKRKKFLFRGCIAALAVALVLAIVWGVFLWMQPMAVEVTGVITVYE